MYQKNDYNPRSVLFAIKKLMLAKVSYSNNNVPIDETFCRNHIDLLQGVFGDSPDAFGKDFSNLDSQIRNYHKSLMTR